jgi:uncharacterized surface protein with fasciclin (FAS1) repeats
MWCGALFVAIQRLIIRFACFAVQCSCSSSVCLAGAQDRFWSKADGRSFALATNGRDVRCFMFGSVLWPSPERGCGYAAQKAKISAFSAPFRCDFSETFRAGLISFAGALTFIYHRLHPRRAWLRIFAAFIPRMLDLRIYTLMKKTILFALSAVALSGAAVAAMHHPMVGGAAMMPSDNIVTNASKANNLKTLVAAVKAADLVDTLASPGPFTVFAPTDAAFGKLPAGTVDTLVKPENKGTLTTILTYHVVPGKVTAQNVMAAIRAGKGQASLTTVQGGKLTARMMGKQIVLTDAKGGKSTVTQANVMQSNGVVHVINSVLMP